MLIVLEGCDGCGKDTVARYLASMLKAQVMNFPAENTVTGPLIRSFLRGELTLSNPNQNDQFKQQSAVMLQSLMTTNRLEKLPELRYHANNQVRHLILCRYWQSGWVYGQVDGLEQGWLEMCSESFPRAHLNILLDCPPEIALTRQLRRGLKSELYEGKIEKTEKIVGLYRQLWDAHKKYSNWKIVDATKQPQKVTENIISLVLPI